MIPPRRVLAAVDFSDASRVALTLAARLAQHCRAELHVLHAGDPLLSAAARHQGIDLSNETRKELEAFVAAAQPAPDCRPHLHAIIGPAVDAISDAAVDHAVDVIVVGSRGMSGATRLMFGSTTEGLLRSADRSILVVPDEWVPPQPDAPDLRGTGPVLAAVDFSDESIAAVAVAHEFARVLQASLEVVHVVPERLVPPRWQPYADAAVSERRESAQRDLTTLTEPLGQSVPVRLRVETGSVSQTLANITAPAPWRQPILVLGRRPPGVKGKAPGAIAYRLLMLAQVPVLVHVPEG